MIYFMVDVEFGFHPVKEEDVKDYVGFYDGRVFRTDGKKIEAMTFSDDDTFKWVEKDEK